jgi:hypothetical protein
MEKEVLSMPARVGCSGQGRKSFWAKGKSFSS